MASREQLFVKSFEFIHRKKYFNVQITEELPIHTWPSALLLVDYLLHNDDLICGKTVLELGSGTGAVICALAACPSVKSRPKLFICTDAFAPSLKNCQTNVNCLTDSPTVQLTTTLTEPLCANKMSVHVMNLAWGSFPRNFVFDCPRIDLLCSADIFFDDADFDSILATFEYLWRVNPNMIIISVYQQRSGPGRIEPFLLQWSMTVEEIDFEYQAPCLEDVDTELKILRFRKSVQQLR